jgi:hypothetical protein
MARDAENLITWSVAVCPQGRRVLLDLIVPRSRVQAPAHNISRSLLMTRSTVSASLHLQAETGAGRREYLRPARPGSPEPYEPGGE